MMTGLRRYLTVALVLCSAVTARAPAAVESAPGEEGLFRRILAESNAYDEKWYRSYSVRYSSRSEMRDESGETVSVTTREGVVLTDGKYASARGVRADDGRVMHEHRVTDGALVAVNFTTEVEGVGLMPPEIRLGPGRGIADDLEMPMQWISVGEYWRALFPDFPLDALLTGELVKGRVQAMDGEQVQLTQQLTRISAREESADGGSQCLLSMTVTIAAGAMSYSVTIEWSVDPDRAYRLSRVAMSADVGASALPVDTIAIVQNADGVWYPSRVHREHAHTRRAQRPDMPAIEGTLTRVTEFTEFTTVPEIPEDAFAAIPPEGSVARRDALRRDAGGAAGGPTPR